MQKSRLEKKKLSEEDARKGEQMDVWLINLCPTDRTELGQRESKNSHTANLLTLGMNQGACAQIRLWPLDREDFLCHKLADTLIGNNS